MSYFCATKKPLLDLLHKQRNKHENLWCFVVVAVNAAYFGLVVGTELINSTDSAIGWLKLGLAHTTPAVLGCKRGQL